MDWEEASKEAVAGSVISSSPESRGVLPTPSGKSGSVSISSTSKTSFSSVVAPLALKSAVPLATSATTQLLSKSSSSGCNNLNKEVTGRLLGSPSSTSVKEGGHLLLKHHHYHHHQQEDSSTSPISLVVVEEDDKDEQKQPTDLSNPKKNRTSHLQQVLSLTTRKNKPIPPPLDLSIGANTNLNLSLHQYHQHNHNNPNHHQTQSSSNQNQSQPQVGTFNPPHQQPHHHHQHINNQHQYHHQPYIGSPKFTQSDKNLPLRKRWHSWSPVPMNGQEEDSIVPLYPDSHQHNMANNKTGLAGVGDTAVSTHSQQQQQQQNQYHQPYSSPGPGGPNYGGTRNWVLDFVPISSSSGPCTNGLRVTGNNGHNGHTHNNSNNNATATSTANNSNMNNNHNNNNDSIPNNLAAHNQIPTPIYTPNEPSPKFMNSPVFSYSNPEYQGPFSPIRASAMYLPPNSPFTNLSINSPLLAPGAPQTPGISSAGGMNNSCFNMIPSTLLSPAPSQASTNSLSYEDLHEKSLTFITPVWSIFMAGTRVRFVSGMNSMDWYFVECLAQSSESLGFKGEYAPHGLEVRTLVVTCSAKERITVTFCPSGDPHHPSIEVNCEPGHPFMVDKKGWCAVNPDVFQEIYGTQCEKLECGDVCMNFNAARSPSQYPPSQQQQQHHHLQNHHHQSAQIYPVVTTSTSSIHHNHNGHNGFTPVSISSGSTIIKMEPIDEKMVPISVVPQTHHNNNNNNNTMSMPMGTMNSPATIISRKTFASPISAPASPAKKPKDGSTHPTVPGETKGRRPMNAFLLFAKDKRPELIQMYPGKDNRSISVLLGEAWQSLEPSEKEKYASNARARAEEQKRMHPDCWKRKRSQSTSS